jgi:hypothetical protein
MSDAFVAFTVLLGGEVEVDSDGRAEGGVVNRSTIDRRRAGYFEGSVTEAEGVAVGATVGVFAGPEEVEIADEEEVPDGGLEWVGWVLGVDSVTSKGQGDRFDSNRWWVVSLPSAL